MRKETSLGKRMGTAALIVSGGVLISRVLGQLREVIFAGLLGASASTDEYVAAFRIPDFLNYLLAGGFLSITFIPILSRYLADDDEEGGWEALSAIIRPVAIAIVGLVAIGWVAAPHVVELVFPSFSPEQIDNTIRFTRIILPAQVFFVLGALFSAVQYTKGVFTIPTLAPIIYNLGIIIGGVAFAIRSDEPSAEGFIWGALIGAFIGNFALQWWGAHRLGMRLTMRLPWRQPVLREYLLIAFPLMIGQSIVILDETFMTVFGQFVDEGAATELNYARRTMLVPVGVIAQAAGVAAYPFLARLFAEGRIFEMKNTVDKAMRYVIILSMAATALVAAMTVPIVRALFERGEFTEQSTLGTAEALFFYAFAVPVWGGLQLLNRAFYARREMWTPVVIGTAATIAAIPLYVILQNTFGLRGVALASTIALSIYTGILASVWYGDGDGPGRAALLASQVGRAIPLAILAGFAAFGVTYGIGKVVDFSALGSLVTTLVSVMSVLLGTVVFVGVAVLLGAFLHDWLMSRYQRPSAEEVPDPKAPVDKAPVDKAPVDD
ncbi:MAG: murein biosynthesis integral membrane protein MurJ [bacterium]|nr:murein biosynthesis integral membrane protein MurJ [bacterium]